MEIVNKFKESDSIVIEGDKKVGKLTFALFLSKLVSKNITLLSPITSKKIAKKMTSFKNSFDNFKTIENFVSVFSFREDWVFIKNEYGYKYLLNDLRYFIETRNTEVIIFYKFDTVFDYSDRSFLELFLTELLSYGITYKKKLVFLVNNSSVNYDLLSGFFVENSDLYLKFHIVDSIRNIDILYSLTPIIQYHYLFKSVEEQLILEPKGVKYEENRDISIVVIASDLSVHRLHKYILDKKNINLKVVSNISDALNSILQNPDFLIFQQEGDDVNFSICELAKKHKLQTEVLYLVNKDFVRVDDRLKSKELGCVDTIKLDKYVMNYILELEKYFNLVFYKRSFGKLFEHYNNKDEFIEFLDNLIEKRVVFTIVKVKDIVNLKDVKDSMREYDKILIQSEYSVLFFLNTLKEGVDIILENKFKEKLEIIEVQDSIEILFDEKLCIK